ncbi:hypothetical protein I5735_03810 [Acinetobacter baumannii]|nr:hypothetical protein [Acinetobacter baumannii]
MMKLKKLTPARDRISTQYCHEELAHLNQFKGNDMPEILKMYLELVIHLLIELGAARKKIADMECKNEI